ncbi:nucleoside/nucleotide kinase family protein [Legionella tunisiensis]|uniref:hypothetical protein n=1 Tax=Legionella tunisiensis TaxID=1034944 RepID=UPI000318AF18|nr:hypothetical protein [Legionella tunisiensis]
MRVFAITGPIGSSIQKFSQQFAEKIAEKVDVTIIDESEFVVLTKDDEKDDEITKLIPAEYNKNSPIDYVRLKTTISSQSGIVIVRGNYLFADESLRAFFDVKVFVSTDGDTCMANYLKTIKPNATTVSPVLDFFETDIKIKNDQQINPLQKYTDITIPEAKLDGPGMMMLLSSVDGLYPQLPKEVRGNKFQGCFLLR